MRAGISHIIKEDLFPRFPPIFQEAMSETNIQGGFRGSISLDLEGVISRLDIAPRAPTPIQEVPEMRPPGFLRRLVT